MCILIALGIALGMTLGLVLMIVTCCFIIGWLDERLGDAAPVAFIVFLFFIVIFVGALHYTKCF